MMLKAGIKFTLDLPLRFLFFFFFSTLKFQCYDGVLTCVLRKVVFILFLNAGVLQTKGLLRTGASETGSRRKEAFSLLPATSA